MSFQDEQGEIRLGLKDYFHVLLKRVWVVAGIFVLVIGLVGAWLLKAPKVYEATATIQINNPRDRAFISNSGRSALAYAPAESQVYYQTMYARLKQPSTIDKVVRYKIFTPELKPQKAYEKAFANLKPEQVQKMILGRIDVRPRAKTKLVDISVQGQDPTVLHRITNALVEVFQEMQRRNLEALRRDTISQFEFKQTDAQLKIATLERELRTFFEENGISSDLFLPAFEKIVAERKLYDDMLGQVRLKLVELEPTFQLVTKMIDEDPENWVDRLKNHPRLRNHERVREIERDLKSLESEMSSQLKTSGPGHDSIRALEGSIQRKRALLHDEKEAILREVIDDVEDYRGRAEKLSKLLEGVQDQHSKYARMRSQYDELNSRIASLKEERARAVETLNTLITGNQTEEETIEIVEYAERPMEPVSPKVAMSLILAAVFGLIGGIGFALVLEYLDDTVKSKEEVDRLGRGIPFLGLIPNISAAKGDTALKDLYAYRQPKSTVAEAFRGVRTALSFGDGSEEKTQRVFLVTSSGPKEGKTTVTLNIATVLAYSGYKTLVIDADLRRPRVHKSFAKSNQVGLTNMIIGRGDDGELIQNTVVENLDIGLMNLDIRGDACGLDRRACWRVIARRRQSNGALTGNRHDCLDRSLAE